MAFQVTNVLFAIGNFKLWNPTRSYRKYHVSVFKYQVYQARPKNNIRTVEPDKLDIKRYKQGLLFVMHHQLILRGKDGHDIIILLPYLCYRDILQQMSVCDNMSVSVLICNFPSGPYGS